MELFEEIILTIVYVVLFCFGSYYIGHFFCLVISSFFTNPQSIFEFLIGSFILIIIILLCLCTLFGEVISSFARPFMNR